ncbi:MAG: hypothetical protein B6D39_11025 [Anaerolineae bacterium UTCFX2]|jgi:hypothetical protein|nr:hypothetical protein [Anaerolineae bacterium]OQY88809.1 MAG: hypothetical protein B6D39_11025 [Anaerolineae bacterium UTCFX2]
MFFRFLTNVKSGVWLGIAGLALLILGVAAKAQAQTPASNQTSSVEMTAYAAFEGNFKYGEWLPVQVLLSNNGPDLDGEIRIPVQSSGGITNYSARVELPAGARKLITVYALPNNFSRQINVELYSGESLIVSQRVSVQPNPNVDYFVGIFSPQRGAISLINSVDIPGTKRPKVLIDVPLDQLPGKYEGLRAFDLLIINDQDTSTLKPEQKAALETWVRQGGRLVVGGGVGAGTTISGLPETLFPATFETTELRDKLPVLEAFSGNEHPIRVPGPFVIAKIQSENARILTPAGDDALIYEWGIGDGYVNFIVLDPAVSPFDAWQGATAFWEKLITPGSAYPDSLPTDVSSHQLFASNMPYALSNLPMLDLPSARGLALMLVFYILLVGPVNYLVLHRMKRLQLAWITIPVITIIFSAASFGVGYLLHGTDIFVNKISLIQVAPTGNAKYDSFIGIFSPAQTAYQVEVRGGGLVSPLSPYYDPWSSQSPPTSISRSIKLVQGDPAFVEGLSIDQWSMQSFMSEGSIAKFGTVQADLALEGDALVGTIRNSTQYTFEDAVIIFGTKFASLGALAPNETSEVNIQLSDLGGPNFGMSLSYLIFDPALNSNSSPSERRKAESRRIIVENLFDRTPPVLSSRRLENSSMLTYQAPVFLGWIDQAPPEVKIVGAEPGEQTTSAVIFPLTYKSPESGPVSIPVGLIPGRLVSAPLSGGSCGPYGTTTVYISQGEAIFEFEIPNKMTKMDDERLKLGLWSDSGLSETITADLYDWVKQDWIELTGTSQGVNLIPDPAPFIGSDGRIQVRIQGGNLNSCIYLAFGLEGSLP